MSPKKPRLHSSRISAIEVTVWGLPLPSLPGSPPAGVDWLAERLNTSATDGPAAHQATSSLAASVAATPDVSPGTTTSIIDCCIELHVRDPLYSFTESPLMAITGLDPRVASSSLVALSCHRVISIAQSELSTSVMVRRVSSSPPFFGAIFPTDLKSFTTPIRSIVQGRLRVARSRIFTNENLTVSIE